MPDDWTKLSVMEDVALRQEKRLNDLCQAAVDVYQILLETELKQRHENTTRRSLQNARRLLLDALRAAGREDLIR